MRDVPASSDSITLWCHFGSSIPYGYGIPQYVRVRMVAERTFHHLILLRFPCFSAKNILPYICLEDGGGQRCVILLLLWHPSLRFRASSKLVEDGGDLRNIYYHFGIPPYGLGHPLFVFGLQRYKESLRYASDWKKNGAIHIGTAPSLTALRQFNQ